MEAIGCPWMCIGGVAVIASGIARYTVDIDATVVGEGADPDRMLQILSRHKIRPRIDDAADFARRHQVLLLEHEPSGVPLDVSFAWLPFEQEAIRSARDLDYAGVCIPIPRPEDLLVYKLVAFRPRDLDDAEKLLALYQKEIDFERVRAVLGEFCAALEDMDRLAALEHLVRQSAD